MPDDRQKARRDGGTGSDPAEHSAAEHAMGELEFALSMAYLAFERWTEKCMMAAGENRLTHMDSMVLHAIHDRSRSTRLTDVAFVLNIDDNHIVAYSLRKLEKLGLLGSVKRGKEKFYETTPAGADLVHRYRACRVDLLLSSGKLRPGNIEEVLEAARVLRELSGNYDQAARRAATAL